MSVANDINTTNIELDNYRPPVDHSLYRRTDWRGKAAAIALFERHKYKLYDNTDRFGIDLVSQDYQVECMCYGKRNWNEIFYNNSIWVPYKKMKVYANQRKKTFFTICNWTASKILIINFNGLERQTEKQMQERGRGLEPVGISPLAIWSEYNTGIVINKENKIVQL